MPYEKVHFVRCHASCCILTNLSDHLAINHDINHPDEYLESSLLMTPGIESTGLHCYFRFTNLNEMTVLNHDIARIRIEKRIIWLVAIALAIAGLPALRNTLMLILEKLYELFIQHGFWK